MVSIRKVYPDLSGLLNPRVSLHYLLPSGVASCKQCPRRDGFAMLTPVKDDNGKYTVKLNCGHKMTDDMRLVVKRYYSRMKQVAIEHRQACLKALEESELLHP